MIKLLGAIATISAVCIQVSPTLAGVKFRAPSDNLPGTVGGATRGMVKFTPPVNEIIGTVSGGSRKRVTFAAPSDPKTIVTAAGGTRVGNTSELVAAKTPAALLVPIALLPSSNIGRAIAERPTFYIYLPATSSREIFFSIQTAGSQFQVYLPISGQGGIVSITLPREAPALEVGKTYRWFVAPIAPGGQLRPDNFSLTGWVKRVNTPPITENISAIQRATVYAANGIWYDTLDVLGGSRLKNTNDPELVKEWRSLLEQVGLGMLSSQPMLEAL
jgi:hypothetical protein